MQHIDYSQITYKTTYIRTYCKRWLRFTRVSVCVRAYEREIYRRAQLKLSAFFWRKISYGEHVFYLVSSVLYFSNGRTLVSWRASFVYYVADNVLITRHKIQNWRFCSRYYWRRFGLVLGTPFLNFLSILGSGQSPAERNRRAFSISLTRSPRCQPTWTCNFTQPPQRQSLRIQFGEYLIYSRTQILCKLSVKHFVCRRLRFGW